MVGLVLVAGWAWGFGCSLNEEGKGAPCVEDGICEEECATAGSCDPDCGPCDTPPPSAFVEGRGCSSEGQLRCGSAADGSSNDVALLCQDGSYVAAFACPGGSQCTDSDFTAVDCGGVLQTVAGIPCSAEGAHLCSEDLAAVLFCQDGSWVEGIHCAPVGCADVSEDAGLYCRGYWCENCGFQVGDLCTFPAGTAACSTDLGAIVACADGRAVLERDCYGGTCTLLDSGGDSSLGCR